MVKLVIPEDCGNAPKKIILSDFTVAFAEGNEAVILDSFDDQVRWEMVGSTTINGKKEAAVALKEMLDGSITELTIFDIITHGDSGTVNGRMKFKDGIVCGFCDVYKFSSHAKDAKIKELTSYIVEAKT
jgi:hypothetical protein